MNSQPGCASTDTHHKLDGILLKHVVFPILKDIMPQSRSVLYNFMAVVLSVQAMVPSLEEAVLARQGPEVQVKVKQWQPHPIV